MAKQLKRWQGWLLFGGSMAIVFVLGLLASSMLERRAEVASIFNNRKVAMNGIVADNAQFETDFHANMKHGSKQQIPLLRVNSIVRTL